jgi:hypothetical protein
MPITLLKVILKANTLKLILLNSVVTIRNIIKQVI